MFYAAGRVHPAFRTALLARELLKKRGQVVTVRLGTTLLARDLSSVGGDAVAATRLIRQHVDRLSECCNVPRPGEQTLSRLRPSVRTGTGGTTTSEVGQIDLIRSEIAHLPPESCLIQSGGFQVFLADAMQIPHTLPEIGRLREVTYRAIGEGTGRHVDLDGYDARYLHLFSWDREQNRVIGAYRIGPTDRIMATHGVNGFYTRTLFQYDERLIARLSPALELGRSFIRSEYQKNFNALLLLWKGIGQFVVRHPQYRVLFGPVSISSRYSDSSHRLLMAFLHQNHLDRDLAALVEALNPHPMLPAAPRAVPRSIDEANKLIADAESDGKGVPVLLRQYLKLNARLLGFNVDPNFGDALDALMTVDLTAVDPVILSRYLGRREAARFLAYHRPPRAADAA